MKPEEVIPGLRAIIAKELIERYGFTKKLAAETLGLTPPAVTLYLQGKRARETAELISRGRTLKLIQSFTAHIAERGGKITDSELYDLAFDVLAAIENKEVMKGLETVEFSTEESNIRRLIEALRERLEAEQEAAEEFMRIAIRLRNDFVRMLIRMIARDSMKHADIIMMIISKLEKGGAMEIDLPDRELLIKLLSKEEKIHIHGLDEVKSLLPYRLFTLLINCIEADEKKHAEILKGLIEYMGIPQKRRESAVSQT